ALAYETWNEQTVELNEGDREVQWKRLRKSIEQGAMTSMINGKEEALWAKPNASEMEADSGETAYSIMSFIDELGTDHHWPGFSTIGTIDPAIETRWRNQIVSYDQLQLDDEDVGLLQAFDDMMERIKFVPPETSS